MDELPAEGSEGLDELMDELLCGELAVTGSCIDVLSHVWCGQNARSADR